MGSCWCTWVPGSGCFAALKRHSVTFKDSVQEFRYEPSSGLFPTISFRKGSVRLRKSGKWRATTTLEGDRYYYSAGKQYSWSPPLSGGTRDLGKLEVSVGDDIEVFCHTNNTWCPGYVERRKDDVVTVAFQLPGADSSFWMKKDIYPPHPHPDLRWPDGRAVVLSSDSTEPGPDNFRRSIVMTPRPRAAVPPEEDSSPEIPGNCNDICNASGFSDTSLPGNWSKEELTVYDNLYTEIGSEEKLEGEKLVERFGEAGLRKNVLQSAWQVANPELKQSAGVEEFRALCRLVGHCQALAATAVRGSMDEKALKKGSGMLRAVLRVFLMASVLYVVVEIVIRGLERVQEL